MMNPQIKDYLDGRTETSLLLKGKKGLPMVDDALYVAACILGCDKDKVLEHNDFFLLSAEGKKMLTVDDAKSIIDRAMTKPSIASKSVVVIDGMNLFNLSSQNKLLKLIEDGEILIIGIAYGDMIKTIESRMVVVNYRPLSKAEFIAKGGENADTLYYISEGVDAEEDEDLLKVFLSVKSAILSGKPEQMLQSLGLVREKDNNSFFQLYREKVDNLFSYIAHVTSIAYEEGAVSTEQYEALLHEIQRSERTLSYTKDDFFVEIASYIETFKKRR